MTPADMLLFLIMTCNSPGCSLHAINENTLLLQACLIPQYEEVINEYFMNQLELEFSSGKTLKFSINKCSEL